MYISTPPSPEVEKFQIKIYYPAGDRTPDLLDQRQTCYHLSQRDELCDTKRVAGIVVMQKVEKALIHIDDVTMNIWFFKMGKGWWYSSHDFLMQCLSEPERTGTSFLKIFFLYHHQCSAKGQVLHCKLRHQGCNSAERQVFHCKLGNPGCSFTRDE